jgi:hypothetical protein
MPDVFIAYCSEDETIGRELAEALERAGYTTWFAERDLPPGPSFLDQLLQAVERSGVFLVVVSPDAIISADLAHTVVLASSLRKPIIGLTVGQPPDDPILRYLIAPSCLIPIPEEGLSAILPDVVSALRGLGVAPPQQAAAAPPPPKSFSTAFSGEARSVDNTGELEGQVPPTADRPATRGNEEADFGDSEPSVPAPPLVTAPPEQGGDADSGETRPGQGARTVRFDAAYYYGRGRTARELAEELTRSWSDRGINLVYRATKVERADAVHLTVTSPETVQPASWFILDVWAHLWQERDEIVRRAREAAGKQEIAVRQKGPVLVPGGCVLSVRLRIEGMEIETAEDTIVWRGEAGNASFVVRVPEDAAEGPRRGEVAIWTNGLLRMTMYFQLRVASATSDVTSLQHDERPLRKAFASYASPDRDEVFKRVQGMRKVAPGIEVVVDVTKLRSGENWQTRLREEILSSDILYLFWSQAARRSKHVKWEWQCGLRERGPEFIDPVPLVSPDEAPPPRQLAAKHFNDWELAYIRAQQTRNLA